MYDKNPALILNYHRSMLADQQRTLGLKRAIAVTVKPGDVVLDLGCGSGILTCFACQAGAQRIYAIEIGPIIELAKAVCKANNFQEKVIFIHELSTRVNLPEKVDVIITETIGNFGLEEGILEWLIDGQARFLKPGGKIIPNALDLFVVPLEQPRFHEKVSDWQNASEAYALDLLPGSKLSANNLHWLKITPQDFLARPTLLLQVDLNHAASNAVSGKVLVQIEHSGVLHGIGGWFNAQLAPSIFISNVPPNTTPSWLHAFFPLEHPFLVQPSDQLEIEIHCMTNGSLWTWQVTHQTTGGQTIRHPKQSTFAGQLLSHDWLIRQAKSYRPILNQDGEITRQVLNTLDGSKSLSELAAWLKTCYPLRFKSKDNALHFVQRLAKEFGFQDSGKS